VELFLEDGRINPNEKGAVSAAGVVCDISHRPTHPPLFIQSGLWCPIHHAADLGHADVIRLFLADPRVDVNAADKVGSEARCPCFLARGVICQLPCTRARRMAKLLWTGPLARQINGAAEDGKRLPLCSKLIRA